MGAVQSLARRPLGLRAPVATRRAPQRDEGPSSSARSRTFRHLLPPRVHGSVRPEIYTAPMKMVDQLLPGRTKVEDRALAPQRRAVEVAERRFQRELGKPMPRTARGIFGRQQRLAALEQAVDDALAALRARLEQLAGERLQLLPNDAIEVGHGGGGGGDVWDDRRYPVVCTSGGRLISLGGCSTLGPAQDRVRWFQRALENRRGQ